MKNQNFGIQDNEGGGDCFYAIMRDGLNSINRDVTIKEIRNKLALEADEGIFLNYKTIYLLNAQSTKFFIKVYQIK